MFNYMSSACIEHHLSAHVTSLFVYYDLLSSALIQFHLLYPDSNILIITDPPCFIVSYRLVSSNNFDQNLKGSKVLVARLSKLHI